MGVYGNDMTQGIFTTTGFPLTCGATMIADRYFITAAHCAGYVARRAGGVLTLDAAAPLADGHVPQQQVAGVFSFAGDPATFNSRNCPGSQDPYCLTGAGANDIALGQLVAPMPRSNWNAAQIASVPASVGEAVTDFGYGCTVKNGPPGQRTQRGFNWPTASFLCGGDSGGPVFRNSDSKIVAINSAGGWMASNVYAIAPNLKSRIEAMIRQLENGTEPGWDRYGNDR